MKSHSGWKPLQQGCCRWQILSGRTYTVDQVTDRPELRLPQTPSHGDSFRSSVPSLFGGLETKEVTVASVIDRTMILPKTCVPARSLQSCLTVCDLMDSSPPGSPVPGICLQGRILERVAMPSSGGPSRLRHRPCISYISGLGRRVLYN